MSKKMLNSSFKIYSISFFLLFVLFTSICGSVVPFQFVEISRFTKDDARYYHISYSDPYAFVKGGFSPIDIIDYSDPKNPRYEYSYSGDGVLKFHVEDEILVTSNRITIVDEHGSAFEESFTEIFNISDLLNPSSIVRFNDVECNHIQVDKDIVFFTNGYESELIAYNVTANLNFSTTTEGSSFYVNNNCIYAASDSTLRGYTYTFNNSIEGHTLELNELDRYNVLENSQFTGIIVDVYTSGDYVFLSDCQLGLIIIDVSNPNNYFRAGFIPQDYIQNLYPFEPRSTLLVEELLFVACRNPGQFFAFNISDISDISLFAHYATDDFNWFSHFIHEGEDIFLLPVEQESLIALELTNEVRPSTTTSLHGVNVTPSDTTISLTPIRFHLVVSLISMIVLFIINKKLNYKRS